MSYGDFKSQLAWRGAVDVVRDTEEKITRFTFEDTVWICTDKNRITMTKELADGYEMSYCLDLYCQRFVS